MNLFSIDDDRAAALARERGTPCFAYDLAIAEAGYRRLRDALPDRVRIAYAVKANPGAPLLGRFARLGAGFDCASAGEVGRVRAARAQVASGRAADGRTAPLLFAGPGKSADDLEAALAAGARIQVDGPEDLERIDAIAARDGLAAPVAVNVRVHPGSGVDENSGVIGGTGPSAFGVDEERAGDFLEEARRFPRVAVRGLHVFAAGNELDHEVLSRNHRTTFAIGRALAERFGVEFDFIDLGGGLGIPYRPDARELDVEALGHRLGETLDANPWFGGTVVLEPGRWLAGPCGTYLARVVRVKESRGVRFVVVEGGINHLLRPLLTGQPFPVRAVGKDGPTRPCTLAGPLCTSLDRLGNVELPEIAAGDLIAFGQAGAYGFTEAMSGFLCRPEPAEHWLEP